MANHKQLERVVREMLLKWGTQVTNIRALTDAVSRGDIDRVVQLLGVNADALSPLLLELQGSFVTAGNRTLKQIPKAVVGGAAFGLANPSVADYLRSKSMELIQDLSLEQRRIVADVLGQVAGRNSNPLTAVRQLIGIKGPAGGQRYGSVVGLSWNQKVYVDNLRQELSSVDNLRHYFTRDRRNLTYDRMVQKAIDTGVPLSPEAVEKVAAAYTDNLIRLRAETIARTEYKEAVEAARDGAVRTLIEQGQLDKQDVTSVWDATGDRSTRPTHADAHDQRRPFGEPFEVGGYLMKYPGDSSLGAPAKEVANCRCVHRLEIDYYAALKRQKDREAV